MIRFLRGICFLLGLLIAASACLAAQAQESTSASRLCGYLGVAITPVTESEASALGMTDVRGALVHDVQDGSPAAKAGVKPNDVVLQFDGTDVGASPDLGSLVSRTRPGHKALLTVLRNGKVIHLSAVLAGRKSPDYVYPTVRVDLPPVGFMMPDLPIPALRWHSRRIGIEYEGVDSQLAEYFGVKQGVLIRFVLPRSPADRAGLKAGDVLVKLNGRMVEQPRELAVLLEEQSDPSKGSISFEIVRDRKARSVKLPLEPIQGMRQ